MILLDTNHLTVLIDDRDAKHVKLRQQFDAVHDDLISTTVVSVEEQCRGWLAIANRESNVMRQVLPYTRLAKLFNHLGDWEIVLFDTVAAGEFLRLRRQRIRIGTQDLKVSAIALVNDALLLTANTRDFEKVPGLRVENW
ncbi:MAG TPA: type II toxin-antitoxin system VapC family toxin, partial [Planctomycetaceae bacterium]